MLVACVLKLVDHAIPCIICLVIVQKKKKHEQAEVRICFDLTNQDKAIPSELLYNRTPSDIFSQAKVFTIVDFTKDYWLIELDKASSFLMNFNVSFAIIHLSRMSFGLNLVGNAFQCKFDAIYNRLNFVDMNRYMGGQTDGLIMTNT